jgi:F-type H+-transporting ATPase subunit a
MNPALFTLGADPISQVVNQGWFAASDGTWLWSAHMGNLVLSGFLTLLVLWFASVHIKTGPAALGTARFVTRNKFAHLIEVIVCYLRDEVLHPFLGKRTYKFLPILLSLFFFILINNLLGLVPISKVLWLLFPDWKANHVLPIGMTATQNLFVTAGLAFIAFLIINIAGIRELGIGGYLKHLTAEAPVFVWPLIIPIEIASTFIKPVALAIRLFANMTAGHILMVVLFSFAASGVMFVGNLDAENPAGAGLRGVGLLITLASYVGAVGIFFLELLVAFIQAFVFTFLTTVFISQLEHHDEHGHDDASHHGHEHAHA